MKTKILSSFVLAATFLSAGAQAQTPSAPATAAAPAPTAVVPAAVAPNQIIYSPRLPTAAELTNAATAQGVTVVRIEQSSAQVTVTYQLANGQTNVVSYQLLPAAGSTVATTTPPPTVVETAPRVVYYEPAYGYYPGYWYPPVSVRLGFGYGFRGGYFHGGFRR